MHFWIAFQKNNLVQVNIYLPNTHAFLHVISTIHTNIIHMLNNQNAFSAFDMLIENINVDA